MIKFWFIYPLRQNIYLGKYYKFKFYYENFREDSTMLLQNKDILKIMKGNEIFSIMKKFDGNSIVAKYDGNMPDVDINRQPIVSWDNPKFGYYMIDIVQQHRELKISEILQ